MIKIIIISDLKIENVWRFDKTHLKDFEFLSTVPEQQKRWAQKKIKTIKKK